MRNLIIIALCFFSASCAKDGVSNDRMRIQEGMLTMNLPQPAFMAEWGKPDRIYVTSGDDIIKAGWGGGRGSFFKGKETYEVWVYEVKKTELVFNRKRRLAAWKSELSVRELAKPKEATREPTETAPNKPLEPTR